MPIQTLFPFQSPNVPLRASQAGFRRFSVAEYHKLIQLGMLTENDDLELLNGYLVYKMPHNPPHDSSIQRMNRRMMRYLPPGWDLRIQSAVTLPESEPEPDGAVVRGDDLSYLNHHPNPSEIGALIEVSDSTLDSDRQDKGPIYAAANIPFYWIINLVDRHVELYASPSGPAANPAYAQRTDYRTGDQVPLVLDGVEVARIPVQELLP
jgi:Uma2 family endonuclease